MSYPNRNRSGGDPLPTTMETKAISRTIPQLAIDQCLLPGIRIDLRRYRPKCGTMPPVEQQPMINVIPVPNTNNDCASPDSKPNQKRHHQQPTTTPPPSEFGGLMTSVADGSESEPSSPPNTAKPKRTTMTTEPAAWKKNTQGIMVINLSDVKVACFGCLRRRRRRSFAKIVR